MAMNFLKRLALFFLFIAIPIGVLHFFSKPSGALDILTAVLVGVTAYYSWVTYSQFDRTRETARITIRPFIEATRLSKSGEIGGFDGEDGFNNTIHIVNVGNGHAHNVNIRLSPPAEAYVNINGASYTENPIHAIHGVELPVRAKRMWNNYGAFCASDRWHYLYAEYEDMEGNEYYTIQSGYNTKTGKIRDLKQKVRKPDDDPFWNSQERTNWLEDIDEVLIVWAKKQKEVYWARRKNK